MDGVPARRRWFVVSVVLAATSIGLYLLGGYLYRRGLSQADQLASVGAFFLALLALLGPLVLRLVGWTRRPPPLTDVDVPAILDQLAADLDARWAGEERIRRIHDPAPLTVRWRRTDGADHAGSLAEEYLRAEPARLVVLGAPGAGKSVLVIRLLRELLARRPGGRVPVIVPATGWDTGSELDEWLAAELGRGHPGLSRPVRTATGTRTTVAAMLVTGGHVLPIIDGLDEVPPTRHPTLIARINDAGSTTPLVVTCRTEQYRVAIEHGGRPIGRATEVELRPVDPDQQRAYLSEATAVVPADRWSAVFDRLRDEPDGPLARALSTPLMLWLARTAYESPASSPSVLADRDALPDRDGIEGHLLDTFVAAAYRSGTPRAWPPGRIGRWLGFLATQADGARTGGLTWWQLRRGMPAGRMLWRAIRFGLAAGLVWGLAGLLTGIVDAAARGRPGTALGALLGGPLGTPLRAELALLTAGSSERYADRGWAWTTVQLRSAPVLAVVLLAAFVAVMVELVAEDAEPVPRQLRCSAARVPERWLSGVVGSVFLVTGPPFLALMLYEPQTAAALVAATLAHGPGIAGATVLLGLLAPLGLRRPGRFVLAPADDRAADPLAVARADRRADLADSVLGAIALVGLTALYAGPIVVLFVAGYTAVMLPLRLLLGGSSSAPSQAYLSARLWLALRGRLPWRTLDFLSDAHRRGVLRQVGTEYQFRHERLRVRLRDDYQRSRWYERVVPAALAAVPPRWAWAATAARRWAAAPAAQREAYQRFLAASSARPGWPVGWPARPDDADDDFWGSLTVDTATLTERAVAAARHRSRSPGSWQAGRSDR